jgi:3',5'-cyclic AMP phosphodiesterase CpdA
MSATAIGSACIRVLHISDLHFGSDHGFLIPGRPAEPGVADMDLADALLEDLKAQPGLLPVDALIISGDVMTHARWMENLDDALVTLKKLRNGLSIPNERIYIIPGNHDYEWYKEETPGVYVRKALKPEEKTSFTHEVHYRNFLEQFYGDRRPMIGEIFDIPGDGFSLRLGLLDSCKLVPSQFHEYGYVSRGQIKTLMSKMSVGSGTPEIRTLVMHHHVSSIVPAEPPKDKADISVTLDAGRLIDHALDTGIGLVLHGHQHYPCITKIAKTRFSGGRMHSSLQERELYILSAGSAGVKGTRRGDIPNTYSVISLSLTGSRVRVRAISAAGEPGDTLVDIPIPAYIHRP